MVVGEDVLGQGSATEMSVSIPRMGLATFMVLVPSGGGGLSLLTRGLWGQMGRSGNASISGVVRLGQEEGT